jgi:hypothetical protein
MIGIRFSVCRSTLESKDKYLFAVLGEFNPQVFHAQCPSSFYWPEEFNAPDWGPTVPLGP